MSHKNVNFEYIIPFLIGNSFWKRGKRFQLNSEIIVVDGKHVDMILFDKFATMVLFSMHICLGLVLPSEMQIKNPLALLSHLTRDREGT